MRRPPPELQPQPSSTMGSFEDLWALIEASPSFDSKIAPLPIVTAAPKNPTGGRERHIDGRMVTDIEVGMPLTGRNNLGEAPLLKLAGDLQWRPYCTAVGCPQRRDSGRRRQSALCHIPISLNV